MAEFMIESVPHRRQLAAMRFVVGGGRRDSLTDAQAHMLRDSTLVAAPGRTTLWWARHRWRTLAAALTFENPGNTAMLFASPADAPEVNLAALAGLEHGLAAHAIGQGMSLVQALLPPARTADAGVLRQAGFVDLAELIYMRRALSVAPAAPHDSAIRWRTYGDYEDSELGWVISQTYRDSLDCPRLAGVRIIDDVIAGHKSSGVFSPDCWWIAQLDGSPAGCILVNDVPTSVTADVVYMGVVPEFRGRGVARAMLARAAEVARERGAIALSLAVDAANLRAKRLYESSGFREIDRRLALAMLRERPARAEAATACARAAR